MIRRPPRSTLDRSSAASDVYKRHRYSYADVAIGPRSDVDWQHGTVMTAQAKPEKASATKRAAPVAASSDKLTDILARLRGSDEDAREVAADDLDALGREGLSPEQGLALLETATERFPPRRFAIQDTTADL